MNQYTEAERNAIALLIASRSEQAINCFVIAGLEILERQLGLSAEERHDWAVATLELGTKYLRLYEHENIGKVE